MPIISYRHSVRGALDEFLEKTKFKGLLRSDAVIEVAASVAQHHEEGVALYPEVYICSDATTFRKQAPDGELYFVGESSNIREGVKRAMKKCTPLTSRDWDIIIEVNRAGCRFGIFKSSSVATSLSLEATYFGADIDTLPAAIRVSCNRPSIVTFRSDCGKSLTVCFNHDEVLDEDLLSSAEVLSTEILSALQDQPLRQATHAFLVKVLRHSLKGSHGSLICIVDKKWGHAAKLPTLLADGVIIEPSIDIPRAISNLRASSGNHESICSPLSYYDLVKGMLSFDGITVFSNDGRIIAYNVFVHAPPPKATRRDEIQGARKRAFTVLQSKLGKSILAAFYQSQDGSTAFKKV
jgi:hypothetical protein